MAVTVTDFRVQVQTKLSQAVRIGLREAGEEIASHANSNVRLQDDAGQKLRGSYRSVVNAAGDTVTVGTPHEEGYWEEFGTGSHADTNKNGGIPGRPMWWVYVTNETPRAEVPVYRTEEEAKAIAASWQEDGVDAHASNGNDPNYTLERAFLAKKAIIERELQQLLKAGLD